VSGLYELGSLESGGGGVAFQAPLSRVRYLVLSYRVEFGILVALQPILPWILRVKL
jgi:hypothetical protein